MSVVIMYNIFTFYMLYILLDVCTYNMVSRNSSVGIATGYGLDDQGRREFESRWGKKFSLLHIVQTGSGVHPTSYKMGTGGSFPGVKRQEREADHSPPTSAKVPPYVFMV
jgi:hypothetical protein